MRRLGAEALLALAAHAPDAARLAAALGWPASAGVTLYPRIREKLTREPVEDYRLDFEDGYGVRPDLEEDATAEAAAAEVARGLAHGTLPPCIGIRIKSFNRASRRRAERTLSRFLDVLLGLSGGRVPPNFVVTLPKVAVPKHAAALANLLGRLEKRHRLERGVLKLELMVETPQALVGADGRSPLPALVRAARGRCVGVPFGVYDFTTALGITPAEQRMRHPVCDAARHQMQIGLAGSGVTLCDGATNVLPVGDRDAVLRAWRLHYEDVRHSLANAYYQGWDLHPAQLPTRYAAVFSFFLESLEAASLRLKSFLQRAAESSLADGVFDDAATGQALV
ncbi:MAG: phosphoenolpyruvate kinase, partial [Gemmatimonadetes bacterium]|nr:phosphoenolpyruvate kinase [Gemmatimonadota bacterium]